MCYMYICVLYVHAHVCIMCICVCVLWAYVYVQMCPPVSALAGSPEEDTEYPTLSLFALFP